MNALEILATLTPLSLITIFLSGLVIGFVYVRRVNFNQAFGYHHLVLVTAFFLSMSIEKSIEDETGWEHWVAALVLYCLYMLAISIGKNLPRFTKVVR